MRARGWVVFALCAGFAVVVSGCNSSRLTGADPDDSQVPSATSDSSQAVEVRTGDASRPDVGRLMRHAAPVRMELERFGRDGYVAAPEHAALFVRNHGAEEVRLTLLPLDRGDPDESVVLCVLEYRHRTCVLPVRLVRIGNDFSSKVLVPADPLAFKWPWRRWGACLGGTISAGLLRCARNCRYTTVAFVECMKDCGLVTVGASLVGCTVAVIIDH